MNGIKWSKVNKSIKPKNVIIVCTGPSLKNYDFSFLAGKGYIIAVNDAGKFLPFADAWFTLDPWGCGMNGTQYPSNFHGQLFAAVPEDFGLRNARSLEHQVQPNSKFNYLHRIPFHTVDELKPYDYYNWGLNEDAGCINTGNSGFGALNLAYHMRPENIFILGLDGTRGYFFDEKKYTRPLNHLPLIFNSSVQQLRDANIEVHNGSLYSTIDSFKRYSLTAINKKLRDLNA
jgi:hypothetical protein